MFAQLHTLTNDPAFQELQSLLPNKGVFSVVGYEDREKVHQRFLNWLLNPSAAHGLGEISLSRLLTLAAKKLDEQGTPITQQFGGTAFVRNRLSDWPHLNLEFKDGSIVRPNVLGDPAYGENTEFHLEYGPQSQAIRGGQSGSLDGYYRFRGTCDGVRSWLDLILEMKVLSPLDPQQLQEYLYWTSDGLNHGQVGKRVFIFISNDRQATLPGDLARWALLTWEDIYQELLIPALSSPHLSETGKSYLQQWEATLFDSKLITPTRVQFLLEQLTNEYGSDLERLLFILSGNYQAPPARVHLATLCQNGFLDVGEEVSVADPQGQALPDRAQLAHTETGQLRVQFHGDYYLANSQLVHAISGTNTNNPNDRIIFPNRNGRTLGEIKEQYCQTLLANHPTAEEINFATSFKAKFLNEVSAFENYSG